MYPKHRIKHLEELQEMQGGEVFFFWNAYDKWSTAKTPFSDVRIQSWPVSVLLSPRVMATPDDPIHYGAAEKKRTTLLAIDDPQGKALQLTCVRATDFNFNGRYNPNGKWWSIFRTREEAELHAVHASLSIPQRCPADQREIMLGLDLFCVFRMNVEPTLLGLTPFRT